MFAGIWNTSTPYPQNYFVISPIDNLCYINITPSPVVGGSDPSVQPSPVWLLFPDETGNTATKCGLYYKTSNQIVNVANNPTTTSIILDAATSWTDTSCISAYNPLGRDFTVLRNGVYAISIQMMYDAFNQANFSNNGHILEFSITRTTPLGTTNNSPIRNYNDWSSTNIAQNPDVSVTGTYELKAGDRLQINTVDFLINGQSFIIRSPSTPPVNSWDYNTFFSWTLIKPLPL